MTTFSASCSITTDWMSSLLHTLSSVPSTVGTFLPTTSAGKLCLEMTHNALVHVFLSVDFTTREQSAERISEAKVSGKWTKEESNSAAIIYPQNLITRIKTYKITYQAVQRRRENDTNKTLKLVRRLGSALHSDSICEPGNKQETSRIIRHQELKYKYYDLERINYEQKTHQDGFTQTRKVLFNCREKLTAFLSAEPAGEGKKK